MMQREDRQPWIVTAAGLFFGLPDLQFSDGFKYDMITAFSYVRIVSRMTEKRKYLKVRIPMHSVAVVRFILYFILLMC